MNKCIYCGKEDNLTKDHIPPKCLFPDQKPEKLITVPCCNSCNRRFSKDDEYFRDMVLMREDIFDQEGLDNLRNKVKRSLKRRESLKYTSNLISGIEMVDVLTKSGLYIGRKARYDVDLNRLRNVINRVTKGLYYYEEKRILDENYDVITFTMEDIYDWDLNTQKIWIERIIYRLFNEQKHILDKIFMYSYFTTKDDYNASVWLSGFYMKVFFISLTLRKEDIRNWKS